MYTLYHPLEISHQRTWLFETAGTTGMENLMSEIEKKYVSLV